jgi:hypothetical protein
MGNKGAFIKFKAPELKPDIKTFAAVVRAYIADSLFKFKMIWCRVIGFDFTNFLLCFILWWQSHPSVKAMAYASNLFSLLG